MGWSQGLFRLWTALTCVWVASIAIFSYLGWPSREASVFAYASDRSGVRWTYPFSIETLIARFENRLVYGEKGYAILIGREHTYKSNDNKQFAAENIEYWAADSIAL